MLHSFLETENCVAIKDKAGLEVLTGNDLWIYVK